MKFSTNALIQLFGTVGQVANLLGPNIPEKYKPYVAGLLGVIQAATAFLSHHSNPDGTPASVAYKEKNI